MREHASARENHLEETRRDATRLLVRVFGMFDKFRVREIGISHCESVIAGHEIKGDQLCTGNY